MQQIRANLTRIKTLIESKVKDGEDIYNYPGVNKVALLSYIDEAYTFSYKLNEMEPKFELTILKRKIVPLIDSARAFLNSLEADNSAERNFNDFLNNLTKIKENILFTYFSVVDKGIRAEEYAFKLQRKIDEVRKSLDVCQEELSKVEVSISNIEEAEKTLTDAVSSGTSNSEEIEELVKNIQTFKIQAESSHALIAKLEGSIKQKESEAQSSCAKIGGFNKRLSELIRSSEETKEKMETNQQMLVNQINLNTSTQDEITKTLDAANRIGMANSFRERKEELNRSLVTWGATFIFSTICIFTTGIIFIKPIIIENQGGIINFDLLFRLALVTPLIWLGWMSAKQYGFISRIREDYAYKFATAMAFEGYKKQAREIHSNFEVELLKNSIFHFSQNPIRLYGSKENHASPIQEVFQQFSDSLKLRETPVSSGKPLGLKEAE